MTEPKSIKTIKDAFQVLSNAAVEQKDEVLKVLNSDFQDLKQTIVSKVYDADRDLKAKMKDKVDYIGNQSEDVLQEFENSIRKEPVKSVLLAGVGAFALGLIVGSNKRS